MWRSPVAERQRRSEPALCDDRASPGDFYTLARDAHFNAAWAPHLVALLDGDPLSLRSALPRDEIGAERAGGAAGRRIFGDTDAGKECARMRDRARFERLETEEIAPLATERLRQLGQPRGVHAHLRQVGQAPRRDQQVRRTGRD